MIPRGWRRVEQHGHCGYNAGRHRGCGLNTKSRATWPMRLHAGLHRGRGLNTHTMWPTTWLVEHKKKAMDDACHVHAHNNGHCIQRAAPRRANGRLCELLQRQLGRTTGVVSGVNPPYKLLACTFPRRTRHAMRPCTSAPIVPAQRCACGWRTTHVGVLEVESIARAPAGPHGYSQSLLRCATTHKQHRTHDDGRRSV